MAIDDNVKVSVILLDWSVREHFQALHFLKTQDVPRSQYELIWVEAFDHAPEIAHALADKVICCGQKGVYHKHKAWNQGILASKGDIICLCDSDAVFQSGFIASIVSHFYKNDSEEAEPKVLMHYQKRTKAKCPGVENINIDSIEQDYDWKMWENTGACLSFRRTDVIMYGGLDESKKFLGYYCGGYELAWRLINAGFVEEWVSSSESVLYHFAHPAPACGLGGYIDFKTLREIKGGHIVGHAYWAVEGFATGRMLPLQENQQIHRLRMDRRHISLPIEKAHSNPEILKNTWMLRHFGVCMAYISIFRHNSILLMFDCLRACPRLYSFLKWMRDKTFGSPVRQ